jgi:subtilisin/minor extracellular protease Epr
MNKRIILIVTSIIIFCLASKASAATYEDLIVIFEGKPKDVDQMISELGGFTKHTYHIINAKAVRVPKEAVETIKENPRVKYIEPDYAVHTLQETLPWGVDRIDAEVVWDYGNRGKGINISILDTGIDYSHPDLADNYKGGYDFVNNDPYPRDMNGHGTHCAGIIAAENNTEGVVGVAPEANLYAVQVLNFLGIGYVSDIIAGLEWAVDNNMDIVSMSFGMPTYSASLEAACDAAYASGVLLVAAAGNEGDGNPWTIEYSYPAAYGSVIAVGATDYSDIVAPFSNTGPYLELVAPGVNIPSTMPTYRVFLNLFGVDRYYDTLDGTSMAAPHVAGVAALILSSANLTNDEVRNRLISTADDFWLEGFDWAYGFGLVDADEAVKAITSCDSYGNPKDAFYPGEDVYVKGIGLSPNTEYSAWIQDEPVNEGDALVVEEDPSGSQELIITDGEGRFGPTPIWSIPPDAPATHNSYDIVVDKLDANAGVYNSASDAIDSADVVGFVAPIPELPTLALLFTGFTFIAVRRFFG